MAENIRVMEDIMSENGRIAVKVREKLSERRVIAVNILGAPGAGKTSVLKRIFGWLPGDKAVIEGDVESEIDTVDLRNFGVRAFQINTLGGCHLDAPMIETAIEKFEPVASSWLFIENIGNLICPAEFDIGEHLMLLICSTADGSDKPYKYPLAFERAAAVVVNKQDLEPYVDFDR